MKQLIISIFVILHVGFVAILPFEAGLAADGPEKCYEWSEARSIIDENQLIRGKDILRTIKSEYSDNLVKVNYLELCKLNGRFVYRAIIIDRSNKAKNVIYDAKYGRPLGLEASTVAPNSSMPFNSLMKKFKDSSTSKFMKKLFSK